MVSKFGRQFLSEPITRLAKWLYGMGITPNMLTYTGFTLTVITAVVLATGHFRWGGALLLLAAVFDMLDGSLARISQQSSTFGAFLDSTLDRYSESVTFLGLTYFYSTSAGNRTELVLIYVILVGSMMVSYTRARAESLNIECKAGVMQRPERVLLLIAGLVTGWMLPTLWLLAIFTNFTALQRIYEVYSHTNQPQSGAVPRQKMANQGDNQTV